MLFHRDSLTGPIITEEEAIQLNAAFDPDEHEPEAGPSTSQAPRRRRVFDGAETSAPAAAPKRSRRWCEQPAYGPATDMARVRMLQWGAAGRGHAFHGAGWPPEIIYQAYQMYMAHHIAFNENLQCSDLPLSNPVEFALAYADWAASFTGFYFESANSLRQLEHMRMHAS